MENTEVQSQQNPAQQPAGNGTPNSDQPTPSFSSQAAATAALFGGKSKAAQELAARVAEGQAAQQQTKVTDTQQKATPAASATTTTEEFEEIETGLGSIKIAKANSQSAQKIETFDAAFAAIKDDFGFEIKTPQDLIEKSKTIKNWRADSQKFYDLDKQYKDVIGTLEVLSEDAKQVLLAEVEGREWKDIVANKSQIDYSKPVEKQDVKSLISEYFKDRFSLDELEEIDNPSRELQIAIDASKDKFASTKMVRDVAIKNEIDNARKMKESFDASVSSSMSRIQESLPFFTDKTKLFEIETQLKDLQPLARTPIASTFFNSDGTLLPDAASRLALAQHGQTIIDALVNRVSQQAESRTTEAFVQRGNANPSQAPGHNGSGQKVSPEAEFQLNLLKNITGNKSVYGG
jgi:hypothetical protein